jgi:transposase
LPVVRERIQAAETAVLCLPPCSPDLNPIEKAWDKLTQLLGKVKARTKEAFDQAIMLLLSKIAERDVDAWFRLRSRTLQQR